MRELILTMSMSLDGFVSGPKGEIDWIFSVDQEAIAWKVENVGNASLHVMGSRTFLGMASYWPTATTVFAPAMNEIPKAVFSKRGEAILEAPRLAESVVTNAASFKRQAGAGSWAEATVLDGDLAEDVARLKAEDGKPIIAHGGAVLARSLMAENLVDRYMLMVYPIVLGRGAAIFSDIAAPRPLELVSTKVFPKGAMAQIYRPG